jgi:hypothetical protein
MGYKLTYFNVRVLGEPIRWILLAADQKFEDDRIEVADWPAKKASKVKDGSENRFLKECLISRLILEFEMFLESFHS